MDILRYLFAFLIKKKRKNLKKQDKTKQKKLAYTKVFPNNDQREKQVYNNQKRNSTKEIFFSVLSLLLILYIYVYIERYIYRERGRKRERERKKEREREI